MQMPRIPLIEKPPVFGQIDVDDLEKIGYLYRTDFNNLKRSVYAETEKGPQHHPTLWSLAQNLFKYATDTLKTVPRRVLYDLDTRPAYPGFSQRDLEWHVDDPDDERHVRAVVLVSSALPTEFLVPGPRYDEFMANQTEHPIVTAKKMASATYANARVEEGILDTYSPEPGEIVMITDHVHRSPYNRTDETIDRVWLRGWLEEMRNADPQDQ